MARPREFRIEDALRSAAEVFWTKGYHAASLEDLIAGTGLTKGSLYKAFHDKRALFLAALDFYSAERLDRFTKNLTQPGSPKAAIRQSLIGYVERLTDPNGPRGCLITNTATELGTRDAEIAQHLQATFRRRTELFAAAIGQAQAVGEIELDRDRQALAQFLELTVQGLRVVARLEPSIDQLTKAVDIALNYIFKFPVFFRSVPPDRFCTQGMIYAIVLNF